MQIATLSSNISSCTKNKSIFFFVILFNFFYISCIILLFIYISINRNSDYVYFVWILFTEIV